MNQMTCREFDKVVHGFVRTELLDVDLQEAAIEHAAHCEQCADRMAEAGVLAETTEAAAKAMRDDETPPHVEAALLTAFRDQRRRKVWWRTFEWATVGAAAAMAVMILWSSATRSKGQQVPAPRRDVSSQSREPLNATGPESPQPDAVADEEGTQIADASAGTYALADFVPVPFTDTIGSEDQGMVVRVQLTRASLAELGYPVAETPDEDLIRADVLVDQDGWPRGVKLVQ